MARTNWLVMQMIQQHFKTHRFWVIAIPVFIAFVAILFIGAWIGWTMATTPPPKPIEEITTEIEDKKEEPKVEQAAASEALPPKKKLRKRNKFFFFNFLTLFF